MSASSAYAVVDIMYSKFYCPLNENKDYMYFSSSNHT
jgi:hypothetical protein